MALIDNSSWLGDAVPYHDIRYIPVPLAACLGGDMKLVDKETTWNDPFVKNIDEISELSIKEDNTWWKLVRNVVSESAKRAYDHHYLAPVYLSGVADIISMAYGMEPLLVDMIENTAGVKKAVENITDVWLKAYRDLADIIKTSGNEGRVNNPGIWAPGSTYGVQEDMSYMLSSKMYNEICFPAVETIVNSLEYPFYHLDGKGAMKHIDSLVSLKNLKAIQWIPGAGNDEMYKWYEFIRYIISKEKSVHLYVNDFEVEPLIANVGTKGILLCVYCRSKESAQVLLNKYGY